MLDDLKFVRNAVATKDFVPELTFFRICDGRVTGYNGELAISSPVAIDLDIAPQAAKFMQAINACDDTVTLKMQKDKLRVISGKFKTFVDCIDVDSVPTVVPTGTLVDLKELGVSVIDCFKKLEPFMGIDASRPWACGLLLNGQSAFATNNIAIVEYWLGCNLTPVNIPNFAVKEILRLGEEPSHLLINEKRISFMYESGRWISSPVSTLEWPDVGRVLNAPVDNPQPFPQGFFEGVEKLVRFGDELGRCYFSEGVLATSANPEEVGAAVECAGVHGAGCYNLKQLLALKGVATAADFGTYPAPVPFVGDRVRGVMTGYKA